MTAFLNDSFTDAAGTALATHAAETGGTWVRRQYSAVTALIKISADGQKAVPSTLGQGAYYCPATPPASDYKVKGRFYIGGFNPAHTVVAGVLARASSTNEGRYYGGLVYAGGVWYERILRYDPTSGSSTLYSAVASITPVAGERRHYELRVRTNGANADLELWYSADDESGFTQVASVSDTVPLTGPGFAGITLGNATVTPTESNCVLIDNITADPLSALYVSGPASIPTSHTGNLTMTVRRDKGAGSDWTVGTPGSPTFVVSGVTGIAKVSQVVNDVASATIVISISGASPGTLTIQDGLGNSTTIAVAAPVLSVSPATGAASSAVNITLTGTNTAWRQETAATLFSLSGTSTLGTIVVLTDHTATAIITTDVTEGNFTLTDNSTGATTQFSVSSTGSIAVNSIRLTTSPYNWYKSGSAYMLTQHAGAYFKFKVNLPTGGNVVLNLDTTPLSGAGIPAASWPYLRVSKDNAAATDTQISASTMTLGSALAAGMHTFHVWVLRTDPNNAYDRWTTPSNVVKITSITLPADGYGAPQDGAVAIRTKNGIIFGDSITEGLGILTGTEFMAGDGTLAFSQILGEATESEFGQIGFGGQGILKAGRGNVPVFQDVSVLANSTWRNHYSAQPRSFATAPDFVVVMQGTNDKLGASSLSAVTAAVSAGLTDMRSQYGVDCHIFTIIPPYCVGSTYETAITDGHNAVADSKMHLVAPATYWHVGLTGAASRRSTDGIHPNQRACAEIGALIAARVGSGMAVAGGGSGAVANRNFDGGVITI